MNIQPDSPAYEIEWSELAAALFARKGLESGLWRLGVKLRFSGITAAWAEPDGKLSSVPTGLVGVDGIAIFAATEPGPMVFDAAVLNSQARLTTKRRPVGKRPSSRAAA